MARQSVTRWACPHALGPQELVVPCLCRLLKDETFADARYMMELLRQTFAALDRANRELGYVHRFAGALTGISVPAVQHRAPCSRDQHSVVKQMLLLFAGCRDMPGGEHHGAQARGGADAPGRVFEGEEETQRLQAARCWHTYYGFSGYFLHGMARVGEWVKMSSCCALQVTRGPQR